MKKLFFTFILLVATNTFVQSYPFKITSKINSGKEKTPIKAATVHIERIKDSTVISYTISNDKGNFSLEGKYFHKDLKLFIYFVGMDTYSKIIPLGKNQVLI